MTSNQIQLHINEEEQNIIAATVDSIQGLELVTLPQNRDARDALGTQTREAWIRRFGDLELEDVGGDGNCQFRVLAEVLLGDRERFREVRRAAAWWMRTHPDNFEAAHYDVPASSHYDSLQEFADAIAKGKEWGNHATLQSIADAWRVEIRVVSNLRGGSLFPPVVPSGGGDTAGVVFIAHYSEFHFGVIRPRQQTIVPGSNTPVSGRGSSASHTPHSALPFQTSTEGKGPAASYDTHKPLKDSGPSRQISCNSGAGAGSNSQQPLAHGVYHAATGASKDGKMTQEANVAELEQLGMSPSWCHFAAEQGFVEAQQTLGWLYETGCGVPKNCEEAAKWYRLAAEKGSKEAQRNLAGLYYRGEGVQHDFVEAVRLYHSAAEKGDAVAQHNLGECYRCGRGVAVDYDQAVKWCRLAAEQGMAEARNSLGDYYDEGKGVTQSSTEAVKWYRIAAEQGDAEAQSNLGQCYRDGKGIEKDYVQAVKWFRKAAEQGHADAQHLLGWRYEKGEGEPQNYAIAAKWYRLSAEQGNSAAQCTLGACYVNGEGVQRDYAEALKWYRLAAANNHADALNNLGSAYLYGFGVAEDVSEAVKWYRRAAEQGHENAQNILQVLSSQGVDIGGEIPTGSPMGAAPVTPMLLSDGSSIKEPAHIARSNEYIDAVKRASEDEKIKEKVKAIESEQLELSYSSEDDDDVFYDAVEYPSQVPSVVRTTTSTLSHKWWLRAGYAFAYPLGRTIRPLAQQRIVALHSTLKKDGILIPCASNCTKKMCSSCKKLIKLLKDKYHYGEYVAVTNTDFSKLYTYAWELAKLFMSTLGKARNTTTSADTTDIQGLLNLLDYCAAFKEDSDSLADHNRNFRSIVQKLRDARNNDWAHRVKGDSEGELVISSETLITILKLGEKLLSTPQFGGNTGVVGALDVLHLLHPDNPDFDINPQNIEELMGDVSVFRECLGLQSAADKLFRSRNYEEAEKKYSEAIRMGYWSDSLLGSLYLKRAKVFEKMAKAIAGTSIEKEFELFLRAKGDAEEACSLLPRSWEAYYRLGKIQGRRNKYRKASVAMERARDLGCESAKIQERLSQLRYRDGKQRRMEHLNTNYLPEGREYERRRDADTRMGMGGDSEAMYEKLKEMSRERTDDPVLEGLVRVAEAQRCQGRGDHIGAVRNFTRAAELGNAEGMYNLARCMQNGYGCREDYLGAIEWLKKAIECSPTNEFRRRRVGVSEAHHSLGMNYNDGIGVEKNERLAWYHFEMAGKLGSPGAQNTLGAILCEGRLVKQNYDAGLDWWRLAASNGDAIAMSNLGNCYVDGTIGLRNMKKALMWLRGAQKRGIHYHDTIIELCEKQLNETSGDGDLDSLSTAPMFRDMMELLRTPKPHYSVPLDDLKAKRRQFEFLQQAAATSQYVKPLIDANKHFRNSMMLALTNAPAVSVIEEMAKGLRIPDGSLVLVAPPNILSIAQAEWENKHSPNTALVLSRIYDGSDDGRISFVKGCVEEFPDDYDLVDLYGCLLMFSESSYEEGVRMLSKALTLASKKFQRCDTLYHLATAQRLIDACSNSSENYERFLELAPAGHRKIPEAYYGLAWNMLSVARESDSDLDEDRMRYLVRKGVQAEDDVHPMFRDSDSPNKRLLESLIQMFDNPAAMSTPASTSAPLPSILRRTDAIRAIRDMIKSCNSRSSMKYQVATTTNPPRKSHRYGRRVTYTPITLEELIASYEDKVYNGCVFRCMVVSQTCKLTAWSVVVQHELDVITLSIYNMAPKMAAKLTVGQSVEILNPYTRLPMDGPLRIRVDDPTCVVFKEKKEVCWGCLRECEAPLYCSKCKKAKYCCKECQKNDWKELFHKNECDE